MEIECLGDEEHVLDCNIIFDEYDYVDAGVQCGGRFRYASKY